MPTTALTAEVLVYDCGCLVARFNLTAGALSATLLGMETGTEPKAGQTLSALADDYHKACEGAKKSRQYVRENRSLFARVFRSCGWEWPADLTGSANRFEDYLADLQTGTTAKTRNNCLSRVRAFVAWLVHREELARNPFGDIPYVKHFGGDGSRALSPPEMLAMVRVAEEDECLDVPRHKSHRSLWYRFAMVTGARSLELAGLRVENLCLTPRLGCVTVPASIAKTRKLRRVPIDDGELEWMRAAVRGKEPRDLVFENKPPRQPVIDSDAKRAGIWRKGETIGMHSFRKGLITAHAAAGTPLVTAAAIAGHSSTKLTEKVYVAQALLPIRREVERLAATGYGKSGKSPQGFMENGEIPDTFIQPRNTNAEPEHNSRAAGGRTPHRDSVAGTSECGPSAAPGCGCTCGRGVPQQGLKSGRRGLNPLHSAVAALELATDLLREALHRGDASDEQAGTRTTGGDEPPGT